MGIVLPQLAPASEDRVSGAQIVDGGLRFDSGKSHYLRHTPGSVGNRKTWTWSGWVKRSGISANGYLFESGASDTAPDRFIIRFNSNNTLLVTRGQNTDRITSQVFRDVSAWGHLVVAVDTTQATSNDRIKIYFNGTQITVFSSTSNPGQNDDLGVNAAAIHAIGRSNVDSGDYFNGHLNNVYLIDGQALGPEYFGYTDPLTNTWRPKKFKPQATPNDGTTWSSATVSGSGTINASYPVANAFNGSLTGNNMRSNEANTDITLTLPSSITFSSSIRVYHNQNGTVKINSETPVSTTGGGANWVTVYSGSGNFSSLTLTSSGGDTISLFAVEVDGVILIDGDTSNMGLNGFYLPLDGNTPIGQDQSGRGNNWTPVNFGGSNTIEKATGALPILNTDGGGKVARVGVRTDSNASSLVLALPLVGNANDVSHLINNGESQKTVTVSGATAISSFSNFYGGSYDFDGTNDKITVTGGSGRFAGQNDFTLECWYYLDATTTDCGLLSNTNSFASSTRSIIIGPNASGDSKITFLVNPTGSGGWTTVENSLTATTGKWTHVALTYKASTTTCQAFVDGVKLGSASVTPYNNQNANLYIGVNGGDGSGYFNGKVQDVRWTNAVKYTQSFIPASTDPDILPDTPSGVAYSSNLALVPSTDGAVALETINDYLYVGTSGDFTASGDFTIEAFVYLNVSKINIFFNIGDYLNSSGLVLYSTNTQNALAVYTNDALAASGGNLKLNAWNHIALVRSGSTNTLYLDGVSVASYASSATLSGDVNIGVDYYNSARVNHLDGFISNLHYVRGTALYTSNFTPPTAPITSVANTKLLCCQDQTAFITGAQPILNTNSSGITTTSGTRSDPNASYLSLCLPMNGSNNGTTFTDQSPTGRTSSAKTFTVTGDTKTVTSQYKFYGSSGYLDGTGDYLTSSATGTDMTVSTGAFTIEFWVNFNSFSGSPLIVSAGTGGFSVGANTSGQIIMYRNGPGGWAGTWTTTTLSTGQWYHIVAQTSSGSGGVWTVYINGISQGTQSGWSSEGTTSPLYIGGYGNGVGTQLPNAYIQDIRIYKGVAKYSSNFTVSAPSVEPSAAVTPSSILGLGNAAATNFNPFTVNINAVRGQESGYCTLNPLFPNPNGGTYSNGNLRIATAAGNGHYRANVGMSTGKWYWETIPVSGATPGIHGIGNDSVLPSQNPGQSTGSFGYYSETGYKQTSGTDSAYGSTYTYQDVIGCAYDASNGKIYWSKNGVWQGGGDPVAGTSAAFTSATSTPYYPLFCAGSSTNTVTVDVNFGQNPFKFPPPAGFQPLALANTPRPTIVRPDQYVGIVTYTGNGGTQSINVGWKPDLVWIKQRSSPSRNHVLYDTVRGATKALLSSTTDGEQTYSTSLSSFDTNGFTLGSDDKSNGSTLNYVGWAWKAGGNSNTYNINDVGYATASAAGLTAGTITPTGASVNTKSGFSIIAYTGTGANATISHGLGNAPSFIIIKKRTSSPGATNWRVYHSALGNTKAIFLSTDGTSDTNSVYWNNTSPSSSVFSLGSDDGLNASSQTHIAYLWAEIPGFSKFGSYKGGGSSYPYINTGFAPAWVMIKDTSTGGTYYDWHIFDNERNPYNLGADNTDSKNVLFANLSAQENQGSSPWAQCDFLSNGFRVNDQSVTINNSGSTYIYCAFAETPSFNLYGGQSNAR